MKVIGIKMLEDGRSLLIVDCGPKELAGDDGEAAGLLDKRLETASYSGPFFAQAKAG